MYHFTLRKPMTKMTCAFTFALLSLGSATAARPDFIGEAIEKGKIDVINTCLQTDYAISLKDKQSYVALAREMVEKKKAQVKKANVFASIDTISLIVSTASVGYLAWDAYDMYQDKGGKAWKTHAAFGLALCKLADTTLKVIKDVMKEEKNANDAVENAEKVAAAIDRL